MKVLYKILVLFQCLLLTNFAWAEKTADEAAKRMLMAMVEAVKTKTYQGTVVYLRGKKAQTMRVYHSNIDGLEQERIIALNSPMREVVRSDDKVTCYFPDSRLVFVDNHPAQRSFLVQLPENQTQYSQFYNFVFLGNEHVIQKETQIIHIIPKDEFRYARKMWVDVETHLPLKFELIDENGDLVEQMMLTELQVVESIAPEMLAASSNIEPSEWTLGDRESVDSENQAWEFQNIPKGFGQVFYKRRMMPTSTQAVDHILFSDGFSSVSVYIDQKVQDNLDDYRKKMGAINSYSRFLDGYQITVLGAVPGKTVQTIGDGINLVGKLD